MSKNMGYIIGVFFKGFEIYLIEFNLYVCFNILVFKSKC